MNSDQFVAMASDLSPTAAKKVGQKIIALAEAEEAQRMENKDVN